VGNPLVAVLISMTIQCRWRKASGDSHDAEYFVSPNSTGLASFARSGSVNARQALLPASYVQKQTAAPWAIRPNIPTILPPNMDAPRIGRLCGTSYSGTGSLAASLY
jgi:hypothetical protein